MDRAAPIDLSGWRGETARGLPPLDLATAVRHLTDPGAADKTLHWGRNYLYATRLATAAGPLEVVVKLFREDGLRARRARRRGSKAERSFRAAERFLAAGVPTPEPLLWLTAASQPGTSYYVSRRAEGIEVRLPFRAAAAGRFEVEFPELDLEALLRELGRIARTMHDAGIRHRDLSVGNVLVAPAAAGAPQRLTVLDLNRARFDVRLGRRERMRELSRLALFRAADRARLLEGYLGRTPTPAEQRRLAFHQGAFEAKNRWKKKLRRLPGGFLAALRPRRAHPHIPAAPESAPARDKIVWDHLSDQPHQHAGRAEKFVVRLADAPAHAREAATWIAALPRIRRRALALEGDLFKGPRSLDGFGVCLRPLPEDPDGLLALVDDLGCRNVLLRLHPWERDRRHELDLARALADRGLDLAFALPQNRDLVRDRDRWRAALEEIGELFLPFGHRFQVGQAINRSKWGVWTLGEYVDLARIADEVLRARGTSERPVELFGPAVIDFEFHATAAALNLPDAGFRFDGVASLLYVDRRGAPENPQLGLDTVGKLRWLRAIAETARNARGRSWITEVNWPLWEGPHSPAGKSVSVDEETQANYLARYFLLALASGMAERVYWWQMIARGYGLVDRESSGSLRRRPSFSTLRTLVRELGGATFERRLPSPPGTYLVEFSRPDWTSVVAGWSAGSPAVGELPRPARSIVERDGDVVAGRAAAGETRLDLGPAVRYARL